MNRRVPVPPSVERLPGHVPVQLSLVPVQGEIERDVRGGVAKLGRGRSPPVDVHERVADGVLGPGAREARRGDVGAASHPRLHRERQLAVHRDHLVPRSGTADKVVHRGSARDVRIDPPAVQLHQDANGGSQPHVCAVPDLDVAAEGYPRRAHAHVLCADERRLELGGDDVFQTGVARGVVVAHGG